MQVSKSMILTDTHPFLLKSQTLICCILTVCALTWVENAPSLHIQHTLQQQQTQESQAVVDNCYPIHSTY